MELKNSKILLLFFMLIISASAQDKPSASSGSILFYLDNASFAGTADKTYTEFYLMFYADQFEFERSSRNFSTEINLNCRIINSSNSIIEKNWTTRVNLDEKKSGIKTKVFYDQFSEYLLPGKYQIIVSASEKNSTKASELKSKMNIPDFSSPELNLSQIEFVSKIKKDQAESNFTKGNKNIIPNPSRRFGVLNPTIYFYYEIYNIDLQSSGDLSAEYSLIDNSGNVVKKLEDISIKKPGNTAAIIHGIDADDLRSGIYTLKINVMDLQSGKSVFAERNFEIIQADFASSQILISEEEAKMYDAVLKYTAPQSILDIYERLDLKGKSEFLIQYWKSQDPTPGTSENEYLQKIQNRFLYAKKNFGWGGIEGWKTDRGKICIKYGIPDEVYSNNSEAESAPYQVWVYQQNRSYEYVFADLRNNGKYVLVHSNREGEISNSNWRELIQKL